MSEEVSPLRQVRAAVMLPGMVTIVVPALLLLGDAPDTGPARAVAGAVIVAAGGALFLRTVRLFAHVGEGTLAPWDAPRRLVVQGPYRYVRNPMITAVITALLGESLAFGSLPIAIWAATVFALNAIWFLIYEEPDLQERFGEDYSVYREHVPRWIPRRTPWGG